MQRRRSYVPSLDGLEARKLLSSAHGPNLTSPIQNNPDSIGQKEQRVDRIPYFLSQTTTRRYLSPTNVAQLQSDLRAIVGTLHRPDPQLLIDFNRELRAPQREQTPHAADIATLDRDYGAILASAGATPQQEANLRSDMLTLARNDTYDKQPSYLVRNDYALIAQESLSVGKFPISVTVGLTTPKAPKPKK